MSELLQDSEEEAYSAKHMRRKIIQHFGERVVLTELSTKETVGTLRDTVSSILHSLHKQRKHNVKPEGETMDIIKTAAKLIESDVKSLHDSNEIYPKIESLERVDVALSYMYISETLQVLLRSMFSSRDANMKLASIGQSIMQAIRPRAILAPLQLGLGVQMHHHFASRFLIDTLHEHGFSCSYAEVQRYERSAAVAQGTEIPGCTNEHSIQFIADNVDHNVVTLAGMGTFHDMGIIATVTPGICTLHTPVPKVSVTTADIAAVGRINIELFLILSTSNLTSICPLHIM